MLDNLVKIDEFKKQKVPKPISANQAYYGSRVDYNLKNIRLVGYDYFVQLIDSLFKTVIHSSAKFTDAGFYIKVDHEMKKMNLHECKNILVKVDEYLLRPHLQESKEREFFMRIRNLCFMKLYYFRKSI